MCQNWATPSICHVPLSSTSVASPAWVLAGTATTRAPPNAGSALTGVVALTTFSVAVNLAKLFLVRSPVWMVPSLICAEVIWPAATDAPVPATAAMAATAATVPTLPRARS